MVFAVAGLWSSGRLLATGRRRYMVLTALTIALMILSHLPATLIAAPAYAAHLSLIAFTQRETRKNVRRAAGAALLGAGLAAFYLLPATSELPLVQIRRLTENEADFHRHFVPPPRWMPPAPGAAWTYGASVTDATDLLPLHISLVQWLAIIAAAGAVAMHRSGRRTVAIGAASAWLGVAAFAMFMMTTPATIIWEHLAVLAYLQFPWRFYLLLSIATAVLVAVMISIVPSRRGQAALSALAVLVTVGIYVPRLRPERFLRGPAVNIDARYWESTAAAQEFGYYERAYDPVGVTERAPQGIGRWSVVNGAGELTERLAADDHMAADSASAQGFQLQIKAHAFPNWVIRIDGAETPFTVTPALGFMEVAVPAGTHRIDARLSDTRIRRIANWITLLSLVAVAALFRPRRRHRAA